MHQHALRGARRAVTVVATTLAVGAIGASTASAAVHFQLPASNPYLNSPHTLVTTVGQDNKIVLQYGNRGAGTITNVQVGCSRALPLLPADWESALMTRVNYKDVRDLPAGQNANTEIVVKGVKSGSSALICGLIGKDKDTGLPVLAGDYTVVKVEKSRPSDR